MQMSNLSENHKLRNFYITTETVPTQSVMKKKMSPPLAEVYFKSMTPKLKVLAGLEPPMKGGGNDWFVLPKELLGGRSVLKPEKRQNLTKLSFNGIDFFGEQIVREHHKQMEDEKRKVLLESDESWKRVIELSCRQQWDETSKQQSKENTIKIQQAFKEFTILYMTSITKIEALLKEASKKEVERVRTLTFDKMSGHYEKLQKQQATMLYDRYAEKILKEKTKLKEQFISDVENIRTNLGNQLHDINLEKHIAIEKLRVLLESQNLACQVYVALKEREECKKEMELSKHEHEKTIKLLKEEIRMQDFNIELEQKKREKEREFIQAWQKKVCHVVKRFQEFVKYCLKTLPEQAEFFIDMEKLMLLQLSEAYENPSVESIFIPEEETFHTPVPKPHPFYLFCDKGYKAKVDEHLCPKHCTSSASQLPVIVVNKKCVYSACDNYEVFAEKLKDFLEGTRGDDDDFIDDHDYAYDIPVKGTSSQELREVKMQSSIMQLLQNEFPNPRDVGIECCTCKVVTCYCEKSPQRLPTLHLEDSEEFYPYQPKALGRKIDSRSVELKHEREPKWDSYLKYVLPTRCHCSKRAKKHLEEHIPAYMRITSKYEAPDIPHYEICNLEELKQLVQQSKKQRAPVPEPMKVESRSKNIGTQFSDVEFDYLCTCFSEEQVCRLFENIDKDSTLFSGSPRAKIVEGSLSPHHLRESPKSFASDRAHSLRNLLRDDPDLIEVFKKEDCNFFLQKNII